MYITIKYELKHALKVRVTCCYNVQVRHRRQIFARHEIVKRPLIALISARNYIFANMLRHRSKVMKEPRQSILSQRLLARQIPSVEFGFTL